MALINRSTAAFLLAGLLGSCATTPMTFPDLDAATTHIAVAAVRFESGHYLAAPPECDSPTVICMDPPPTALEGVLEQQVYGPALPARFTVATTSHYGLEGYDFGSGRRELILVLDDGKARVMPRYHRALLRLTSGGEWAVPVLPYPIQWLPCKVLGRRVEITSWADPSDFSIAHTDFDNEGVSEHPQLFVIDDAGAVPRYGLRLADIAAALELISPRSSDFSCESQNAAPGSGTAEAEHKS